MILNPRRNFLHQMKHFHCSPLRVTWCSAVVASASRSPAPFAAGLEPAKDNSHFSEKLPHLFALFHGLIRLVSGNSGLSRVKTLPAYFPQNDPAIRPHFKHLSADRLPSVRLLQFNAIFYHQSSGRKLLTTF
jgi:hypothetical protein